MLTHLATFSEAKRGSAHESADLQEDGKANDNAKSAS
jgi:hypothetical protein